MDRCLVKHRDNFTLYSSVSSVFTYCRYKSVVADMSLDSQELSFLPIR